MTPNTPWSPTGPCCAGRGPGKYLPSKAPVYPWGAVTSGWTPFNIYPCGFHRSAAQARQTLLIKTGACFKEPHSGRQSALAGQKSLGHVAAGKPELGALFRLHFHSTSFSTRNHPVSKSRQDTHQTLGQTTGPNSKKWIIYSRQHLETCENSAIPIKMDFHFLPRQPHRWLQTVLKVLFSTKPDCRISKFGGIKN